jgi:hypothetical protein
MTVVVPQPVPLELPPGDPAALEDLVEDVAGTAYHLAVVSTCLTSSSATAPHWRGADASSAAARIGVVASLAQELSGGVAAAAHRLRTHHDRLVQARQRVTVLRAQQDEDFAVAWGRLSRIENYQLVAMTGGPQAVGIVEDLQAAEAARRREHGRLLDELAEDAAVTARELAAACRPVGGGNRADGGPVIASLAAALPGWGDAELRRRGAALAEALTGLLSPAERETAARAAACYAGSPAFAGTFLTGLGEYGIRRLLTALGDGDLDSSSALARTLALAFGAAVPTGRGSDAVGDLLAATYVDRDDVATTPDLVALGMGIVLRAGGAAGPRPETALTWGRQMLARERVQGLGLTGSRAVDRAAPVGQAVEPADPMGIVLERLIRDDDPSWAAAFLTERSAWDVLLSRPWDDDAHGLSMLIRHAGTADGPVGADAARAGLEALGAGLDDGHPGDWTVDKDTAAAVAGSLGGAVVAHISPVAGALERAADGEVGPRDGDALRGLGYVTLDEGAARAVQEGLHDWARNRPGAPGDAGPAEVAAVEGAFVAAREYGQRLAYALHGFEQQAAAQQRKSSWDWGWGLLPNLVRRAGPGVLAGIAADYIAIGLDRDGTWDNGPDDGLVLDAHDAELAAREGLSGRSAAAVAAIDAQAREAFRRTTDALGRPMPPTSPPTDWWEPVKDAGVGVVVDKVGDAALRRVGEALDGRPPGLHAGPHE